VELKGLSDVNKDDKDDAALWALLTKESSN
jgi:hypothetical protein